MVLLFPRQIEYARTMTMNVDVDAVGEAILDADVLNKPKLAKGIDKYLAIQKVYAQTTNLAVSEKFQSAFKTFYGTRHQGRQWHQDFFDLMQKRRNTSASYRALLEEMAERQFRCDASFCSKMRATFDPSQVVIDQEVLKTMRRFDFDKASWSLKRSGEIAERIDKAVSIYLALTNVFDKMKRSAPCREALKRFDDKFGNAKLTETKKLDLMIWQAFRKARE